MRILKPLAVASPVISGWVARAYSFLFFGAGYWPAFVLMDLILYGLISLILVLMFRSLSNGRRTVAGITTRSVIAGYYFLPRDFCSTEVTDLYLPTVCLLLW